MSDVVTDARIPEFDYKCKIERMKKKRKTRKMSTSKKCTESARTEQIEFSLERLMRQKHFANRFTHCISCRSL